MNVIYELVECNYVELENYMKSILVECDVTVREQRYKYSRIYQLCEKYFVIRNICEISDNSH